MNNSNRRLLLSFVFVISLGFGVFAQQTKQQQTTTTTTTTGGIEEKEDLISASSAAISRRQEEEEISSAYDRRALAKARKNATTKKCIQRKNCKSIMKRERARCIIVRLCDLKSKNGTTKARSDCRAGCSKQGQASWKRCARPCQKAKTRASAATSKRMDACMKKRKCREQRKRSAAGCKKDRGCNSKVTNEFKDRCRVNCSQKGIRIFKKCKRGCENKEKNKGNNNNNKPNRPTRKRPTRAKKKTNKKPIKKPIKKPGRAQSPAPTPAPTPVPDGPMVSLVWDENNAATIEFCQDGNETFGYRLPGASYCGPVGLVIRVAPGQSYNLTVQNSAATESTNIHAHGVHISGDGNANDVTRVIDPTKCLTYYWTIPADHMGGTHWIHSLMKGSAQTQVLGGAFAMLIVEESSTLLSNVPLITNRNNIRAWLGNELLLAAYMAGSAFASNGNTGIITTLDMTSGEWYRLRLLTVQDNGGRFPVKFLEDCDVHVVAWDGVWRFGGPDTIIDRDIEPTGSGRTDLAIRCDTAGQYNITTGGDDDADQVAILNVVNGTTTSANPFLASGASWEPARPNYLRDLSNGDTTLQTLNNSLFNEETIIMRNNPLVINDQPYNETKAIDELEYDTLQKWRIFNSGLHPFHLHVYHMQTFNCIGHEDGQYYDTVSATNSACVVLFHITDYSGRTVAQCQHLGHVDAGMLIWFDVVQGSGPNAPPVQSSFDRNQKTCPAT